MEPNPTHEKARREAKKLAREILKGSTDLYRTVHRIGSLWLDEGTGALSEFVQLADEWENQYGLAKVEPPHRPESEIIEDVYREARRLLEYEVDEKRPLRNEIRKILLNDWDPIGVLDIPEAHDEYDSYIPKIVELLTNRSSLEGIAEYLSWVESDRMGIRSRSSAKMNAARKIVDLLQQSN